ncbi:hypothetical protein GCM10010515_06830 [Streptomyces fructofermentans]|uniref:Uncharacterized protein n=1 Tax=Streptomyces fructofermentans TaxID=152141 RepID=A0A918K1B4_9ACTN|nr:hypothetical protein GCM10010515_06830 [Streptomyces fructofermentans]
MRARGGARRRIPAILDESDGEPGMSAGVRQLMCVRREFTAARSVPPDAGRQGHRERGEVAAGQVGGGLSRPARDGAPSAV